MPLTRTSRGERHARLNVVAVVALVAAAGIWCSQAVRKAERQSGNDLVGYLEASRALYEGADPYHLPGRFPYIYPLFLAAVIRPLAAVPLPVASVVWFALQSACLWYVLRLGGGDRKDRVIAALAVFAVFGDVLQSEFLNGQVNILVLALSMVAIHLTDRKPHAASALLGTAIAVKLTPALFLLYWLIERRYRTMVESVLWASVFTVSPWLVVQDRLWPLYSSYLTEFIFARTSSADPHAQAIFFTPYGFWGWLSGAAPGRVLFITTSIAVLSALAFWHWRNRSTRPTEDIRERPRQAGSTRLSGAARSRQGPRSWDHASVYAAATPLLSPMSEVHHLTFLIPTAMINTAALGAKGVAAGTALFVVLIWIGRFQRTGPWYFLAILSLIVTAGVALQRSREASH